MFWLFWVACMVAVPTAVGINMWFEIRRQRRAERERAEPAVPEVNVNVNA
jgi:hypothetical protein